MDLPSFGHMHTAATIRLITGGYIYTMFLQRMAFPWAPVFGFINVNSLPFIPRHNSKKFHIPKCLSINYRPPQLLLRTPTFQYASASGRPRLNRPLQT